MVDQPPEDRDESSETRLSLVLVDIAIAAIDAAAASKQAGKTSPEIGASAVVAARETAQIAAVLPKLATTIAMALANLVNNRGFGRWEMLSEEQKSVVSRVIDAARWHPNLPPHLLLVVPQMRTGPQTKLAASPVEPKEKSPMATEPHSDDPKQVREGDLWHEVLEKAANDDGINTALVVRRYREAVNTLPILRLIQDANERIAIYHNLLEEVKREPFEDPDTLPPGSLSTAQRLKQKYEGLGLVPSGHLPNPWAAEAAAFALKKMREYGALLLDLVTKYADDIIGEMNLTPEVTVTFDVELKLPPGLSIGVERAGSMK